MGSGGLEWPRTGKISDYQESPGSPVGRAGVQVRLQMLGGESSWTGGAPVGEMVVASRGKRARGLLAERKTGSWSLGDEGVTVLPLRRDCANSVRRDEINLVRAVAGQTRYERNTLRSPRSAVGQPDLRHVDKLGPWETRFAPPRLVRRMGGQTSLNVASFDP